MNALGVLIQLREDSDLDAGEIEAISLAIELHADFISNDTDAVSELNASYAGLGATGKSIQQFVIDLEARTIISQQEKVTLLAKLNE